jgi:hypothetical protein
MRKQSVRQDSAEKTVRDIRRGTRRQYSAEEKIRIVLKGLRGEASIAELCRKEGIAQSMYHGLVEGVPGSRQTAAGGRYGACGDLSLPRTISGSNNDEVRR